MITEDWENGYDVILAAANFLFNIDCGIPYQDAQRRVIEKAAQALRPGGYLLVDYGYTLRPEEWFCYSGERIIFDGKDSSGTAGKMVPANGTFDRETGVCRFLRRYELTSPNGENVNKEIACEKYFPSLEEVHSYLSQAGFSLWVEYGDYHKNPIGEHTGRALLWAQKR